jgi:hypothetical protein
MTLTREEQKSVLKMVMESYNGISINEIKSNQSIKYEIQLNLEFYSGLKESLMFDKQLKEAFSTGIGFLDGIIAGIGSIKDLLTTSDIGKWLSEKVKSLANKFFPSFKKDPNDWTDKFKSALDNIAKWLGPKFIAYVIAAWKAKSFKPGEEAIQAQMEKANKIYKRILMVLIALAAVKLIVFLAPFWSAAFAKNVALSLGAAAKHAGLGGFSVAGFNIVGLINKIKHASYDEAEHAAEEALSSAQNSLSQEL